MILVQDQLNVNSNGVAVLFNKHRFSLKTLVSHPQLLITQFEDAKDKERIICVNAYINPTSGRDKSNEEIIEKITTTIRI